MITTMKLISFFALLCLSFASANSFDLYESHIQNITNISIVDSIYVSQPAVPPKETTKTVLRWEDCFDEDGDFLTEICGKQERINGSSPFSIELVTGLFGSFGILIGILASISKGELKRIVLTILSISCILYAGMCFYAQEGVVSSSPLVGFNVFITLAVFLIESPVKGSAPLVRRS
eukprot:TRINITY_DN3995_c0_g1_i1.p1 TRINITY_DN3995_c0_g1~~TRINITY_DN3995_c0_g1_i1.p1  ORF type:complete len:177 (+),score=55.25 TRINITY_DN3995_c0_g1_i1:136-666(+)